VHFSLRDNNLVVQAQGNQRNETLELIHSSTLQGDLPPALIDGHVHWLNLCTKIIEIRPLEQLWEQSSDHWRIDCASEQYRMYRGRETLIDIRSPTWAMVSKCFECLNSFFEKKPRSQAGSTNLLITTSRIDSESTSVPRLCVALPNYGLSFFVNETEDLESRDFKDMVYDENQCVGALFGLESLLVLRSRTYLAGELIPEALIPRRVLIPNGHPIMHGDHRVQVNWISFTGSDEPLYHTYNVDNELGCLIGDGSLRSIRLLAYVHAMTSCHPDPLTSKTGAQAALCLLHSAGCRSIMKHKALNNAPIWTSTKYPQINDAYKEILKGHYWDLNLKSNLRREPSPPEKHTARRAAYLFASPAGRPTSQEDYNESKYLTTCVPAKPGLATLPHSISSSNECSPKRFALDQLLCNRPAPELPARSPLLRDSRHVSSEDIPELDQLFSSLRTDSSFQRAYLARLDASAQCIRVESQMAYRMAGENLIEALEKHYVRCRVNYLDSLDILKNSLGPTTDPHEQVLDRFGQWPPITADVLLRYLASASPVDIPPHWKKCLILLALLLLDLQRSR
jgi:hypothetical protein